ncbi:hypothetical protein CPF_0461 [Clostridium perfringens ATCC 13124]|uniref:Uncharacterized protein n=1 Tax=Clostridium perfringens (strain ATCC 13124 / DSM 756 / JCM 1290 / NCIMB 6125 / NCTC 8237 / Type A) TaxID=195103 RepID=A0A0H2YUU2_CLOP1|nr:hypothetical protein CPF_0461 [Clostridium perfringens ATCC 13124]
MKNIFIFILFIAIDYFLSIGLFISLNFIFFKINSIKFNQDYKKYNFYFYFLSKLIPVFLISIFIIKSAKFIGLVYLLFSVIYKIIDFIKFLNYFDKKDFK